jgi:hypothetical protein
MRKVTLVDGGTDTLGNSNGEFSTLSESQQGATQHDACRLQMEARRHTVRMLSCALWWLFTLAVASSPWWAKAVNEFAEHEFVASPLFLAAQLSIAAALVLLNLLGAPWRVVPEVFRRRPSSRLVGRA